ncbi:hypothetical protein [uncultured Chryseobacterium sp.]|uniref:hypothetical protein n=1 Tax=uncultured Chryseobacterium sp. TaxID=259322 RepID=UPI0025EA210F|nr:hypothetical protein [uncultured Chryseobacterium sp.]
MIYLKLLNIVKEVLPDFNGGSSSDLIKAEKILKTHQKIHSEFSLNDIENFLSFYKENGNTYTLLFQDENLSKILNREYFKIDPNHNRIFPHIMDITPVFRTFSEEPVKHFIQINIRHHDWENLRIFYKNYFPVISLAAKDFLIDQLTQKNNLIRSVIPQRDCYYYLTDQYRHGINPYFYALQSDIDAAYFNEEIMGINNTISDHQNTEVYLKVFLGRVLMALGHFDAYTEELRGLLKNNSKIGAEWAGKEMVFHPELTEESFRQRRQEMQHTGNYNRPHMNRKPRSIVSEWIIVAIYYLIILGIFASLYHISEKLFAGVLASELIIFLFANKRMNKKYGKRPEAKDHSWLGKNKKSGYKLMQLQLYTITIGGFIMIFAGYLCSWYEYPLFGVVFTIIGPYFIMREMDKIKKKRSKQ